MGDVNSLYECMRAEARGLNLDRTPWRMTWEACDRSAHRKVDGVRVSARELRVEPCPTFRRRAPRHGCQSCLRGSRPSSRVPSALSLTASRLGGGHSARTVLLTGTCRAPATIAAGLLRVRSDDGTTTALHHRPGQGGALSCSAGNRRSPPLTRHEQLRVEGSPLSRGRRDHCCSPMIRDL